MTCSRCSRSKPAGCYGATGTSVLALACPEALAFLGIWEVFGFPFRKFFHHVFGKFVFGFLVKFF